MRVKLELEELYRRFNIREDIKYGDLYDIIVALGMHYFWSHEGYLEANSFDEFYGYEVEDKYGIAAMRTASKNRVKFPVEWNHSKVEGLKQLFEFINKNQIADSIRVVQCKA